MESSRQAVAATELGRAPIACSAHLPPGPRSSHHQKADGRQLPSPPGTFDVVIIHTVLSHVPGPDRLVSEAFRVLRPQICHYHSRHGAARSAPELRGGVRRGVRQRSFVGRRLPVLVQAAGFENLSLLQGYGLTESLNPSLSLTWIERGADAQLHAGLIGADLAATLKTGADRRASAGSWFGYMAYASLTARTTA